jgi:hypothetical protein
MLLLEEQVLTFSNPVQTQTQASLAAVVLTPSLSQEQQVQLPQLLI